MADLSDPKIDEDGHELASARLRGAPVIRFSPSARYSPHLRPHPRTLACYCYDGDLVTHAQSDRSDKLKLTSTGSGGLTEAARASGRQQGVVRLRARPVRERQGVQAREVHPHRLDRPELQGHAQGQGEKRPSISSHDGGHAWCSDGLLTDLRACGRREERVARVLDRGRRAGEGRLEGGAHYRQATEGEPIHSLVVNAAHFAENYSANKYVN
ncbi:hypothetical protein NUW54_g12987 [Trametes sanguinea]|uniref:Uncharacterized protein n=1 Tax=Trametes sanguinea TaxID=158606 RepID=A0ACC1MRK3_9APHY|nr:hypothetical protein NUW54_g12987 [Trametes sanguinea]